MKWRDALSRRLLVAGLPCLALPAAASASAHDGHDHDDGPPAAAAARAPRFEAKSDLFELVGILDKGTLRLFLDRHASNEPVIGATIDIEVGAEKKSAQAQPDGTYLFASELLGKPGTLAFAMTVTAGAEVDLLAANLVIPEPHHDHPADSGRLAMLWPGMAAGIGLSVIAALVGAGVVRLLRRRAGGAP